MNVCMWIIYDAECMCIHVYVYVEDPTTSMYYVHMKWRRQTSAACGCSDQYF